MVEAIAITAATIGTASGPTVNKIVKSKGIKIEGWDGMSLDQKKGALIEHFDAVAKSPKKKTAKKAPGKSLKVSVKAKGAPTPTEEKIIEQAHAAGAVVKIDGKVLAPPGPGATGLIEQNDIIATLTASNAPGLVTNLLENIDKCMFILGGVLCKIAHESWISGHKDFKAYVEEAHGMKYRKAAYLMQIYKTLTEQGIPSEKVANIGWSKTKEILGVLGKGNDDYWLKHAEESNLQQLIHDVKQAKGKVKEAIIKKKYFLLHEGEQTEAVNAALAKALAMTEVDGENEALTLICTEFLGNPAAGESLGAPAMINDAVVQNYLQGQANAGGAVAMGAFEVIMKAACKTFGVELGALDIQSCPDDWPTGE